MKQLKILFFGLLSTGFITACGNTNYQPEQFAAQNSDVVSQISNTAYLPANQQCAQTPNVLGNDGAFSSEYRACNRGSTAGTIALYPSDSQVKGVCVVPVRLSTTGQANAIIANNMAPLATRYVYQCANVQASGSTLNFHGLNFNALYVVEAPKMALLAYCISTGDVGTCAAANGLSLSFGQLN